MPNEMFSELYSSIVILSSSTFGTIGQEQGSKSLVRSRDVNATLK